MRLKGNTILITGGADDLINGPDEIGTNIVAPVHLTAHLIPHLKTKQNAVIINNKTFTW
jgi:short-subunit dehydrogenase involved in D-alanine esterification of teichoic acids